MRSLLTTLCVAVFLGQQPERVKVEISVTPENMPAERKAGTRVDVKIVTAKTIAGNGKVLVQSKTAVADLEIASAQKGDDKAATWTVTLLATAEQAARIEKLKAQKVAVVERGPDGGVIQKMIPIPLRLEVRKDDSK